ncbi:serine hydrolase domain-containing protein [Alkalihalobacterium chitinilyticum]|uniref:Beta-lactamase family protein n=1 Tax=Alkalihalobacterium chitinilyticum TaxID=2980103 RepID=A0ABT5VFL8_9BACI|nr:serine hydrolase domain-containing protein [Alkalihalobacterium chitinilyticum]MDE5414258.1 beta-lactamase family protein [Alkalihalobacterium chitinilyticum]
MGRLRRLLCCFLIVSFLLHPSMNMKLAAASAVKLDTTDVEEFLDTVIARQMEEFHIPNMTVSVVSGGEVIFAKGYGYADNETKMPVDPEKTLFRIGSTSKLFTWTAVMQLVEEGKLDLDTDINEYLDFEIPNTLEYHRGDSQTAPITIRHLMSHTPGFEDYMTDVFSISDDSLMPLSQYVREHRPKRVFAPGEVTAYSNYGTNLAGYIVEFVSGVPFAQYIEENIYNQLEMENSTFSQPLPTRLADQVSIPSRYVNGEFLRAEVEFFSEPAGSMYSSAIDMAKFMLAYLQGGHYEGEIILKEDTIQKMFSEVDTQQPRLKGMAHGFIKASFNGKDIFHHPGGTMLYDTAFYLMPEEEVGFFISHSGGNYLVNVSIFEAFMDRYFPSEEAAVPAPEPTLNMEQRSKQYVGEYYQNRRSFTTDDAILSLMIGVIRVNVDDEGYLLVNHLGETNRFVEIEPGVYYNVSEERSSDYGGDFSTIVFGTDSHGKTMLMTDGPMSYSKAAWYESSGFTFLMLISSLLFIIASLLYWGITALVRKIRGKHVVEVTKGSRWAKRVAVIQGLLTFTFLVTFLANGQPDPVYGFPKSAFTDPSPFSAFLDIIVSYGIVLVTGAVLAFSVVSWVKGYWKLAGRVHYMIFAIFSAVLSWIFYFWNVL